MILDTTTPNRVLTETDIQKTLKKLYKKYL